MIRFVIKPRPWHKRPLRCLLAMHQWLQHPGIPGAVWCPDCEQERSTCAA